MAELVVEVAEIPEAEPLELESNDAIGEEPVVSAVVAEASEVASDEAPMEEPLEGISDEAAEEILEVASDIEAEASEVVAADDDAEESPEEPAEEEAEEEPAEEEEEEEEEDEEDLVDPRELMKERCGRSHECKPLFKELGKCNERLENGDLLFEGETCQEELFNFIHCVDHCIAPLITKVLK